MLAIIALNVIFAVAVIGAIVGLLAHSVWTSRTAAPVQPGRARVRTQTARRLALITD